MLDGAAGGLTMTGSRSFNRKTKLSTFVVL
jgi:hypothetical protein